MFILHSYAFSGGFFVFEIRKNLDLRKILVTPKIFLKSSFHCTEHKQNWQFSRPTHRVILCWRNIWIVPSLVKCKFSLFIGGGREGKGQTTKLMKVGFSLCHVTPYCLWVNTISHHFTAIAKGTNFWKTYFLFVSLSPCWSVIDILLVGKSSSTNWIFSLQKSISKLNFAGYNSSLSNLIFTNGFFKNQVQINRG